MKKTYKKKPLKIEAIQFNGWNWAECYDWMSKNNLEDLDWIKKYDHIDINTREGFMKCEIGDYLIKGVNGEFYPCKPEIFEKTYEEI